MFKLMDKKISTNLHLVISYMYLISWPIYQFRMGLTFGSKCGLENYCNAGPFLTHLAIKNIWILYSYVMASKFFYHGIPQRNYSIEKFTKIPLLNCPCIIQFTYNIAYIWTLNIGLYRDCTVLVVYTVFSAFSFSLCFILFLLTHVAASSSESLSPRVLILLQHTHVTLDTRALICIISQLLNQILVSESKISPKQLNSFKYP